MVTTQADSGRGTPGFTDQASLHSESLLTLEREGIGIVSLYIHSSLAG